jgi:cyclophilin family peptidyl-prolyl cis-trans isomerase/HEAT repeat protein
MRRQSRARVVALLLAGLGCVGACRTAVAPPPVVAPPPAVSTDRKIGWILRLEQERTLREPNVGPAMPAQEPRRFLPASVPALDRLALDPDPAIRRRAVLAIGRVGMADGVPLLVSALADPDVEVRASAAFALGLLGPEGRDGAKGLRGALEDPALMVRARAVEGLGLIGDASAAGAIGAAADGCGLRLAPLAPDDEEPLKAPEIEICRLALFALARLREFDQLAMLALTADGQPVSRWWPVAYALQRIGDARAAPALLVLASASSVNTAGFAFRGLGALKDRAAVPVAKAVALNAKIDVRVRVAAVRALGQIAGPAAIEPLMELLGAPALPENLALETVAAIGGSGHSRAFDVLVERLADRSPAMRAAALTAVAKLWPDAFLVVLSGLGRDPEWSVRATLATLLGVFPADRVAPAIVDLLNDDDARVHGPALEALAAIKSPDLTARLFSALEASDFMERATAARLTGETRPEGGLARLVAAYTRGQSDTAFIARSAALEALSRYGGEEAKAALRLGLADREWPVRWRAATLLHGLGELTAAPIRPAPLRMPVEFFESAELLRPPYAPHAFVDTARGTVEVELNVVDAPLTAHNFVELARAGFFNGMQIHRVVPSFVVQAGDPRGDGEGGPGYSVPDELSPLPYLRGTMGMALDWRDTAGSQWFIALSPQPHLDARYTVFGRVVNGWDVLDRLSQWDVIDRVRIWDGVTWR